MLERNLDELERLSRRISDMLFIANSERIEHPLALHCVDLAKACQKVAGYLGVIAEEKSISIMVQGSAEAMGDSLLIERAV